MEEVDVIIVGAGPTGLVLAIELALRGITIKLVDKEPAPAVLSRALLVQARTLEIFEEYKICKELYEKAHFLKGIRLHTQKKVHDIDFVSLDSKYPYGVILPQTDTEALLRKKLETLNCHVEWNKEVISFCQDQDLVTVKFKDTSKIKAKYLIAADGAHSTLRHELNLPFEGNDYNKTFALGDVVFKNDPVTDRIELFTANNFLILFPMPKGMSRIVVDDQYKTGDELTIKKLQEILNENHCPYVIEQSPWLSYFHIHFRKVNKYRVGRVFLAGDAAHIHSPAGGLGMNTGIQDAYNLGWKLAYVIKGLANQKLLDTYEEERMPVAKNVLKITEKITDIMVSKSHALKKIRDLFMPFLMGITCIKRKALNTMAQLEINYKLSSISKGSLGGNKIRNDEVFIVDRQKNHLFELTKSTKFVLLIHTEESQESFTKALSIKNEVLSRFSKAVDVYMVRGNLKEDIILIRPDEYIAFSGSFSKLSSLLDYLDSLFT